MRIPFAGNPLFGLCFGLRSGVVHPGFMHNEASSVDSAKKAANVAWNN